MKQLHMSLDYLYRLDNRDKSRQATTTREVGRLLQSKVVQKIYVQEQQKKVEIATTGIIVLEEIRVLNLMKLLLAM